MELASWGGPIGWWWEKIYVDLFDRNTVLMIFLGWELFMAPFFIAWGLVGMTFALLSDLISKEKT